MVNKTYSPLILGLRAAELSFDYSGYDVCFCSQIIAWLCSETSYLIGAFASFQHRTIAHISYYTQCEDSSTGGHVFEGMQDNHWVGTRGKLEINKQNRFFSKTNLTVS